MEENPDKKEMSGTVFNMATGNKGKSHLGIGRMETRRSAPQISDFGCQVTQGELSNLGSWVLHW